MIKRGLAVVALIGAVAGVAYVAIRYLRSRQPERESLPGAYVPQPLPSSGLSPAPVAMPAEVGIEAADPGEPAGIYIPRPGGTAPAEAPPEERAAEAEAEDTETELPSAAELEAEESIAGEDEEAGTTTAENVEAVELPGETGDAAPPLDMDESDLADALLEETAEPVESAPLDDRIEPDLWSPAAAGEQQVDPVLAHFEAMAASEEIDVERREAVAEDPQAHGAEPGAEPAATVAEMAASEPVVESETAAPATAAPAEPRQVEQREPEMPSAREPSREESPPEDTAAADALLDEGNAYFNVGQFALAIQRYDRAIQIAPRLVAAYYNRANARTRIGDYDGAQSDYDTALGLNPTDADALNNRGMLHLYRGNHDAALQDFNLALGIDSRDGTVIVNRGLAYLHKGDPRAALSDFHEAIRLNSRDAAAHYGAAQSLASLDDTNAALMSLRNALRIEPSYAREAAAEPRFAALQSNDEFTRILRNPNG